MVFRKTVILLRKNFESAQITSLRAVWICVSGKLGQENHASSVSKTSVFVHTKTLKPTFLNFSSLKSVYELLRFRDGLVYTVRLTLEIELHFQISVGTSPKTRRFKVAQNSNISAFLGDGGSSRCHLETNHLSVQAPAILESKNVSRSIDDHCRY